jgi:hypothetical protein
VKAHNLQIMTDICYFAQMPVLVPRNKINLAQEPDIKIWGTCRKDYAHFDFLAKITVLGYEGRRDYLIGQNLVRLNLGGPNYGRT